MTDERHQTHLPAAWGEQLPPWTEPLRTPAGCAATVFVLCCFAPIFLFKSTTCVMGPIRDREADQLKHFEDLRLEMLVWDIEQLKSFSATPDWKYQSSTFNGFPVDRFTVTYPSPYAGWETCELTFDAPEQKQQKGVSWTIGPTEPLPDARLISIKLEHRRKLTPEEVVQEFRSLEQRFPSRHTPLKDGNARWPAVSGWDDWDDTKIRNQVWYWYQDQDDPRRGYLQGATLMIELQQEYTSD